MTTALAIAVQRHPKFFLFLFFSSGNGRKVLNAHVVQQRADLENESINHLFFDCSMARYVWSLVAYVVGADSRPCSFDQFWVWAKRFLPLGGKFLYVGLAAICWALWRMRNTIHFDKKVVRSPTEIICLASLFIFYWAKLQMEEDKAKLEAGAEALKKAALSFHPQEAQAEDAGVVLLH